MGPSPFFSPSSPLHFSHSRTASSATFTDPPSTLHPAPQTLVRNSNPTLERKVTFFLCLLMYLPCLIIESAGPPLALPSPHHITRTYSKPSIMMYRSCT
ncbi:uncharacterized protein LY89DRAFT_692022 [Mollisia scopiformis]|uniref:Uncharacterized protein n=1 Tax=Mollisia scopiformis TaxID=149040 RepID=A0A132B3L0_MOLSC|nr:uncharacterized protein LY89DRAFT_692022 [Mollisia scopiformis]KUJ06931.1 hypothetical protein LY89DRAFT_692022 [Mollisia scopiformis]